MKTPVNRFKRAIAEGRVQYGLWLGLTDPISAEIGAGAGFDWVLIDAEHAPNDVRTVMTQLQAVAPYDVQAIVRLADGRPSLIKQILDVGAQTLLIPMVETAAQAQDLVAAVRYPPRGVRGVGTALARAARWNRVDDYFQRADEEVCLIVQVESVQGLDNLKAIAAVEGVDGVFIGPADLAGSLGHLGNAAHPDVQHAIRRALEAIAAAGKAPGVMATEPDVARDYVRHGAVFIGAGADTVILARATQKLAEAFKGG